MRTASILLLAFRFVLPAFAAGPAASGPAPHPGIVRLDPARDGRDGAHPALAAVYRAYGIDPAARRLRERLGSADPAPGDFSRLLGPDGFSAEVLPPAAPDFAARLDAHLSSQQLALAMLQTPGETRPRWVVFTQYENDIVEVADPRQPDEPRLQPVRDFAPAGGRWVILLRPTAR